MRKFLLNALPYAVMAASLLSLPRSPIRGAAHTASWMLAAVLLGVWMVRMHRRKMLLGVPVTAYPKAIQRGGHITTPVEVVAAFLAIACDIAS